MSKRLPSPAMVVACVALFVAMGGTGYAATQLASDDQATASKKAKRKAKGKRGPRGLRGKRGPVGPAGASGAPGAPGAPGSAKAWAVVYGDGSVRKSFNVIRVSKVGTGQYCIETGNGVSTANSAALVTLNWSDLSVGTGDTAVVASEAAFNACVPDTQFYVRVADSADTPSDGGFSFMVP